MTDPARRDEFQREIDTLRNEIRDHYATKEYIFRVALTTAGLVIAAVGVIATIAVSSLKLL